MCTAVVVATGADGHVAVGAGLLVAEIDVLVEKPMADDDRGGALLLAGTGPRILQVGHIERFNSAVRPLRSAPRSSRTHPRDPDRRRRPGTRTWSAT